MGFGRAFNLLPHDLQHNLFIKRELHVRKSVPDDVCLCELGRVPLHLFWQKIVLKYVSQLSSLPNDRLVKLAFNHACSTQSPWCTEVSSFLSQHHFQGLLADAPFLVPSAIEGLRKHWYHSISQSTATKPCFVMDNVHFDFSDYSMAPYLAQRHP